jgi:putative acetyltransferase
MRIITADFSDYRVNDLLRHHLATARAATAPGSAHTLDIGGLQAPGIEVWTIWHDEDLLGIGALQRLAPRHGEVKSMHIVQSRRRTGAGSALLRHIIAAARDGGLTRLSLETGSWAYFHPAHELYRKYGFVACPPFGDYVEDPNSVFITLELHITPDP